MIEFHKNEGETPLEALGRLRQEQPDLAEEKMTYAGRLDPMAEGILPVLVGEECKEKEKYTGCDKEYEVEVLFGFATDTGDILGKVFAAEDRKEFDMSQVQKILSGFVGKQMQTYPAYSSKTVDGRALHEIARAGEIDEVEMPTREIEIYSIDFLQNRVLKGTEMLSEIERRIQKVSGDFRQNEILELWQENLADRGEEEFQICNIGVRCSSGTYMRVLAENMGKRFEMPALAWKIVRTKIFLK